MGWVLAGRGCKKETERERERERDGSRGSREDRSEMKETTEA